MNIELLKQAIAFEEVDGKFSYRLGENIHVEEIPNEDEAILNALENFVKVWKMRMKLKNKL